MKLPKEWTTVTVVSKTIAMVLFIVFPIIAFVFGMNYQRIVDENNLQQPTQPGITACTEDAKICPDGSTVGRIPPNCDFAPCPTVIPLPTTIDNQPITCGGVTNIKCPQGYVCQTEAMYPDATGTCVKNPFP